MSSKLPEHVIKKYGSAHAFRARKRELVKEMRQLLGELVLGSAYFPNGSRRVDNVRYELEILARELSVKSWGK